MNPRQKLDSEAWRIAVTLFVFGWLAVDLSPLGWPAAYWLLGAFGAWMIHEILAGRDRPR